MPNPPSGLSHLASLLLVLATVTPGLAGELSLLRVLSSEEDLLRVETLPDGGFHVLHHEGAYLLDLDGRRTALLSSTPTQRVFLGDSGTYFGRATFRSGAADFAPAVRFELYRTGVGMQWEINEIDDVSFAVSALGTVVGLDMNINRPERNALHFYGAGGELMVEVRVPHLLGGRFSADGAMFFAQSATDGMVALSKDGVVWWRHPDVRVFAATPHGDVVAMITGDAIEVVRDGSVTASRDLKKLLVRRIAVSSDAERIAVVGRDELRVFDDALRVVWSRSLAGTDLAFTSVDIGAAEGWLLTGVARDLGRSVPVQARHPDGRIQVWDSVGNLCHETTLAFEEWNIFTPTVCIDASGTWATVTTRRAVCRLDLP